MHIDLHLGLHKTATTHLQGHWAACAALATGVRHVPLVEVRAQLTPAAGNKPEAFAAARSWLSGLAAEGGAWLLSDENLLGSCEAIFASQALYPQAGPRLHRLAPLFDGAQLRIWLAVRGYADFIRSAWCEAVRHTPYRPFRRMYKGIDPAQRGWEHLVHDIHVAFPRAELMLFAYEDLTVARPRIARAVFGLEPEQQPAPADQRERQSLSAMAVQLLDEVFKRVDPDTAARVRHAAEKVVAGPQLPRFEPWTDAERQRFAEADARSLAALQSLPGVTWVR